MTHHPDNPILMMLMSAAAGVMSWSIDQHLLKALVVAMVCGFVGGLGRAAGLWTWNKVRERRKANKA